MMGKQSGDAGRQETRAGTRVTVLGYGEDAREQALCLRRAGVAVTIGVRPGGMSWLRAKEDGFVPVPTTAAAGGADIVVVAVPEEDQPSIYLRAIAPTLAPGALLVFGRGHALYAGAFEPSPRADVVLVTACTSLDRAGCRVAVHQDATGEALERAAAYARAAFGEAAASIGTTTVADEVLADLAAFEDRVGGADAFLAELDEVLRQSNHEPDQAKLLYYQSLRDLVARRAGRSSVKVRAPVAEPSASQVLAMPGRTRGVA